MIIRVLTIIGTVVILQKPLMAYNLPACAETDTACLLRTLEFQARENEAQRLRLEYLSHAQQDARQWAQQEKADKEKCQKAASDPPSRMRWFLLGAAGTLALGLGIAIAAH